MIFIEAPSQREKYVEGKFLILLLYVISLIEIKNGLLLFDMYLHLYTLSIVFVVKQMGAQTKKQKN